MRTAIFIAGLLIAKALDRLVLVNLKDIVMLFAILLFIIDLIEFYFKIKSSLPKQDDKEAKWNNTCDECIKHRKFAYGKELEFISIISRDGIISSKIRQDMRHLDNTKFQITCLSITNKTYIANEFNSYVVKFK